MSTAQPAERLERLSWGERREGLLKTRERAGYLFTMSAIVVYGLMPTMVRLIYDMSELTPLQLSFWRFALSAPVLWFISLSSRPNHRPFSPRARASMPRTVLVGLFYGLSSIIAFQSLLYIPPGYSSCSSIPSRSSSSPSRAFWGSACQKSSGFRSR